MSRTRPNIVVPVRTAINIYDELATQVVADPTLDSIAVGTKIAVQMIGGGIAKLYAGASLTSEPTNATGFEPIYERQIGTNEEGDEGAFIWSEHGCVINVKEA